MPSGRDHSAAKIRWPWRARPARSALVATALAMPALVLLVLVLAWLFPPGLARLAARGRIVMDRQGEPVAFFPDRAGEWKYATRARAVDPLLIRMLIGIEDKRYYADPGVDPLAAMRATAQLLAAGHVVSGASTLAMQVARLLHPAPRTLRAKLIEAFRALALTERYSKARILGMWLSLAPFGGNIVGVQAASRTWFGKSPAHLSADQAALLIALCRRPEALRPDRHPRAALRARNRVLAEAAAIGLIPAREARRAEAAPVPHRRHALARQSPQITRRLAAGTRTTLDFRLNAALAADAARELAHMRPAESLAILIVDARTRAIRAAYVGEWAAPQRAGFLDLSRAIRSPGSALKPFLYGLAFADGLATPATLFRDLPGSFGSYGPDDFTHHFMGVVTAATALRRSLNLPAVRLMRAYGPDRFAAHLAAAGAPLALPRGAGPSLPLALGGAGIAMRHLVALYAALATDGTVEPLHLIAGKRGARHALLSPAIADEVAGVLTRPLPEGGPAGIAWKTGTSAGNRDDWAIGFDRQTVVAVWVGRPDGGALPGAAAIDRAVPILTQVFGLIRIHPRPQGGGTDTLSLAPTPRRARLQLASPPPGAVIADLGPIEIRAVGGDRPLTFLIDGKPIASIPALRAAQFRPEGPGFYRLRIIDASGHSIRARLHVVATTRG